MFLKDELEDEWSLVMSEREAALQNQRDLVALRVSLQQLQSEHSTCAAQLQQLRAEKPSGDVGGEQSALLRQATVHSLRQQVDILTAQVTIFLFFQIMKLFIFFSILFQSNI